MKAFLFSLFCITGSFAQTKLISHKSHSGSAETFRVALAGNLFDIGNSNLGDPRPYLKTNLDSVIYVSEAKAIWVTSEESHLGAESKPGKKQRLNSRRDTIFDPAILSKKHELDSIKKRLKRDDQFSNSIDSVVFVGYDNEREKRKKSGFPLFIASNNNWPKFTSALFLLASSLFAAYFIWKTRKTEVALER